MPMKSEVRRIRAESHEKRRRLFQEIELLPPLRNTGKMGEGKALNVEDGYFLNDVRGECVETQDIFSEETATAVQMRLDGRSLGAIGDYLGVSGDSVKTLIKHAMVEWEDYILGQ
jgi:hypothetical protein